MNARIALCAALMAALPLAAVAQHDRTAPQTDAAKPAASASQPITAEQFMMEAAANNIAEVATGRLAVQKGATEDVRTFGQKMVDDHTRANEELKALAEKHGVDLPNAPKPEHQKVSEHLNALNNESFDVSYARQMVVDHDKAITLFERASTSVEQADVKAYAEKTLPVLRQHAQHARMLAQKMEEYANPRGDTDAG
jgi:putative membrane protein